MAQLFTYVTDNTGQAWQIGVDANGILQTTSVAAIPTSSAGSYTTDLVTDCTALVRSLLNDADNNTWTDTVLLPFVNAARDQLCTKLVTQGIKHLETYAVIVLGTGDSKIDFSPNTNGAVLPSDFKQPVKLVEQNNSSTCPSEITIARDGVSWRQSPASMLYEYEYVNGALKFNPASVDVTITMRYSRSLGNVAAGSSLGLVGAKNALAFKTAALAARSRGARELAADYEAQFEVEATDWIAEYWRPQQRRPIRRLGYGRRRIR